MIRMELPYPPTANRLWRVRAGRIERAPEYQAWMQRARWLVQAAARPGIKGRYVLNLVAHRPDKRRRDLDNLMKAVCDALAAGGLVEDDSLADVIVIRWAPEVLAGGRVDVEARPA